MHLDEAIVDTGSGEVVSNKPVEVFTQDATLNADRLEVEKSGEIVRFIGSVVMNLQCRADNPKPPAEKTDERANAIQDGARRCRPSWPPSPPSRAWRSPAR